MELDDLVDVGDSDARSRERRSDSDDEQTDPSFADSSATELVGSTTLDLKVMNVEYTDSPVGTLTHLFGRTRDGSWRHVEVVGHEPSFFVHDDECDASVANHYAVTRTEEYDSDGERYESITGEPLTRVYTTSPEMVGEMRELFTSHWEADVLYENRWLIDNGIKTGVRIDTSDADYSDYVTGDMRVHNDDVTALDVEDTPSVEPKQLVVDIEVGSEDGVPDAESAEWPVTTIVAWDSYSESYVGWLLHDDTCEWSGQTEEAIRDGGAEADAEIDDLRVFSDESAMLDDFHRYVSGQRADLMTGWFSNDFDIPYLINRSKNLTVYSYDQWSPLGEVWDGHFEPNVSGVSTVDMLAAYQKTQIHNLDDKSLDAIAAKEVDHAKVDLDRSHTEMWREDPVEFLRYNKVDVELVHEIDDESGAVDLLDNLRSVVGCSYEDPLGGNIDMMDMLFLRKAREYGIVLPSAEKPSVGDFHGAYVYQPEAGLHEHVVYPDYSSLYPNMMYQCNVSPETLIGTAEDLAESEYTEDDAVWSYLDTETPPPQKSDVEADESKMEKVYFVDPSIEEGFIRSVLDDVMGLADSYTGGMYAAVKRVRNSTYGVLGDSDSYGDGFRLFDWRLSEAVTLGGQRVLKEGGRVFADEVEDPDAEVVYGDTDSVVTTIPNADSGEDALQQAMDAAEDVNEYLDEYAAEQFGLDGPEDARMELEIESYSRGIFFKGENDGASTDGVKKRYVQMEEWDDSFDACASHDDSTPRCESCRMNGWLEEPELTIKGFEYVRSDVAQLTKDVQYGIFERLFDDENDTEERVKEYVRSEIAAVMDGSETARIGIPFGISQSLDEYGAVDQTPQPQYRGASYANKEIYGGDAITEGDKPKYYYIEEGETGPLRSTYDSHTKEDGRYVDAISVIDADDLPEGVQIDREKMIQKTIVNPTEAIFRTLDWGAGWLEDAIEDAKEPEDYRDDDQRGLDEMF